MTNPFTYVYRAVMKSRQRSADYKVAQQLHRTEYRQFAFAAVLGMVQDRAVMK